MHEVQALCSVRKSFREKESVTLWITDDGNKIPIRLQADLAIGSIKVDLEKFKNLTAPFKIKFN